MPKLFDDSWVQQIRGITDANSWVNDAINTAEGSIYFSTLQSWFDDFPLKDSEKRHLCQRLRSQKNDEHLGAVNELTWWTFMAQADRKVMPLPASNKVSKPDFYSDSPYNCAFEVTTLNLSAEETEKIRKSFSIRLDHGNFIRRMIGKLTDEKYLQLAFSEGESTPAVLVVFDYTEWSGYGVDFASALHDYLLGKQMGFLGIRPLLSALVYVHRCVMKGRIAVSVDRSVVLHNPFAERPASRDLFPSLKQNWVEYSKSTPIRASAWIYLS